MNSPDHKKTLQPIVLEDSPHRGLFRCSQFILGQEFAPGMEGWQHVTIGHGLKLTAHPELNVVQVRKGARSLTGLGMLLDPNHPNAGDRDILEGLLEQFESLDQLMVATSSLGGRWAIIATDGHDQRLFHDAFGLRQVFYTVPEIAGRPYAMSEAAAGAVLLDLPMDGEARTFMNSAEFRREPEYKWPAASSPFQGIQRLLPNHYLDLRSGDCRRFWPNRRIHSIGIEEGVEKIAGLLTGMLRAAVQRFELAVAVTCGIDSRVVLAACKDIKDRVSFVTVRQWRMDDESPDITVPGTLLARLGLGHDVIHAPVTTTPEFIRIFKSSTFLAHDHYGPDVEAVLGHYQRSKVAVTGSGGEVGRRAFRADLRWFDHKRVTPDYLSRIEIGSRNSFALKHFDMWLTDVGSTHGINKLDLFEWEQGCGSWLATTQLEFDMAWKDIFTPFNCRDLVVAMLAVPVRYRKGPDFPLFQRLIQEMWPEVQDAPINPHKRRSVISQLLYETQLVGRHVLQHIRYR